MTRRAAGPARATSGLLRALSVLACFALCLASPASAQRQARAQRAPGPSQLIIRQDAPCPADRADEIVVCGSPLSAEGLRVLEGVAQCMAQYWPAAVRRLLLVDFRAAGAEQALRWFAATHPGCAPAGTLRVSGLLLAGGMAEALLRNQAGGRDLAARVARRPSEPPIRARDESEYMSLCAVRADPAEAAALFAARPASGEEMAIVRTIAARLAPCLAAGTTAHLNRPALRALLALAAYRLSEQDAAAP